jgi:hypothetical protein
MNLKKKKIMKKYPVDDLFARKLGNWQPKPSADLWRQIEQRQKRKTRRLEGWHWYAAASVALMLMVGYAVWTRQLKVLSGTTQEFVSVDRIREPEVDIADSRDSIAGGSSALANSEIQENKKRGEGQSMKIPRQSQQTVAVKEFVNQPEVLETEPVLDRLEVAAIQKIETSPESLVMEGKSKKGGYPKEVRPEIANESLTAQAQAQDRVIIAHIETSDIEQEDQRSSKFIRILRQLKNAKQGEAIEWDEVGFNPKKLMARADERLRNEEEKVSRRYQELKEKTNL